MYITMIQHLVSRPFAESGRRYRPVNEMIQYIIFHLFTVNITTYEVMKTYIPSLRGRE